MTKNGTNNGERPANKSSEAVGVHAPHNPDSAPGQSSASDWDMDRTKPSGDDAKPTQKSGKENEQPEAHNPPPGQGAQNTLAGEAQKTPLQENQHHHHRSEDTQADKTLGAKPISDGFDVSSSH